MAHHSIKESYKKLEERINRFPQGAPPAETLYKILALLFTEKEARLVAQIPIKPFTPKTASKIWRMGEGEAHKVLEQLASRCILLDTQYNDKQYYMLPPPMAGFFEFALMRVRKDIDQKLLSELYHQYLNVEEDFIKDLFLASETRLGRAFVQEPVLTNDHAIHILDYERASHIIGTSSHIGVSMCYCRHKMEHIEMACDAPMDICLTFNNAAASLIKHKYARRVDKGEAQELLQLAYEHNLVQCGENVRQGVSFICNCCGCCCEGLLAARKFGSLQPIETTNYIPKINGDNCNGCGKCTRVCPIEVISLVSADHSSNRKKAVIDEDICLGCGVCVRSCPKKSIILEPRKTRVITPVNSVHRVILMAIDKGKLPDLIFDNQALASHRAMAAVLSAILKLPPIKRAMASRQMKSVYLEKLIAKFTNTTSPTGHQGKTSYLE